MPNFITQSVSLPRLPIKLGETEFLETARGRNLTLVRTKSFDSEFFIIVKPSGDKVIVKGEKITKPAKISHLQRALEIFKERFCGRIISQAFAYKDSSLTEKTPLILDENEILSLVKSSKFNKIFIEIGFGSGRHLLHQARSNQDALLIGIEIYKPAIEQVAKLAIREGLQNIALIATDARVLLSLLPAGCLQRVFLHFPVPWDDALHRRVISDEFASQIARTLELGGRFELRTDSEEYFLYTMQKLSPYVQRKAGEILHFKNRDAAVASKYEDRWRKMDKDIYDLIYENKTAGLGEPQQFEMEFLKFDAAAIARNFKNSTFKGEDFFVHFEEIFYFDAQKSLEAGGTCAADGANLSSAGEVINDEATNLDAMRGGNLTERASMDEISLGGGKILATTAGDKILACENATQILKKTSAPLNTNSANEAYAKDSANLNENCLNASDVDLTSDVSVAVSAKFSRPAPSEKRALACEQIATKQGTQINSAASASDTLNANDLIATIDASNALNSSGAKSALAATDATDTGNIPTTIDAIDASNAPNSGGSFAAARTNEANAAPNTSVVPCKKGSQTERQSKPSFTKQQDKQQSNLEGCAKPRAEHQSKLNRAERKDKRQSEPSYAEQQAEQQSKPCTAEPQDVLILLSLGAFDFPQQCFIRANASGTRYFIRRPLPTRENHAAHQKISEIFSQWQR
ncbi:tRNA (guanosine(46)-N7)-methyltransferase TrmB [uncultured Campylobacter sp.]|uniref:tRNA (guanosine(46)-N7)-methyltransferase TrmB n=1 Tax=uncultured Campylobacter sp. TaxID=218934 RepID=UPI00261AF488|nr:tRNA (guanosine(46)-N7)-methyltransferase TrmB [uncultured Campylobacter sp.]